VKTGQDDGLLPSLLGSAFRVVIKLTLEAILRGVITAGINNWGLAGMYKF